MKVDGYGSAMRLEAVARIYSDARMNWERFILGGEGFVKLFCGGIFCPLACMAV